MDTYCKLATRDISEKTGKKWESSLGEGGRGQEVKGRKKGGTKGEKEGRKDKRNKDGRRGRQIRAEAEEDAVPEIGPICC